MYGRIDVCVQFLDADTRNLELFVNADSVDVYYEERAGHPSHINLPYTDLSELYKVFVTVIEDAQIED